MALRLIQLLQYKTQIVCIILLANYIVGAKNQDVIRVSKRAASTSSGSMEASPAISAVLLECPNKGDHESDAEQQLMVNVRVSPSFRVEKLEKYLILDEVYDHRRQARAKIMSPYLIEISRGEPVVMYPLEFSKTLRCDACGDPNCKKSTRSFSEETASQENLREPNDYASNAAMMSTINNNLSGGDYDEIQETLDDIRHQQMNDEQKLTDAIQKDDPISLVSHEIQSNEAISRQQPNDSSLCGEDDNCDDKAEEEEEEDDDDDDDYVENNECDQCIKHEVDDNSETANGDEDNSDSEEGIQEAARHKINANLVPIKSSQRSRIHSRLENYRKFHQPRDESLQKVNEQLVQNLADRSDRLEENLINGYREQTLPIAVESSRAESSAPFLRLPSFDDSKVKRRMDLNSPQFYQNSNLLTDDFDETARGNQNVEYRQEEMFNAAINGPNKKLYYPLPVTRSNFEYPKETRNNYPKNWVSNVDADSESISEINSDDNGVLIAHIGNSPMMLQPVIKKKECNSHVCGNSPPKKKCPHKRPKPNKCQPNCPNDILIYANDNDDLDGVRQRSLKEHYSEEEANKNGRTGDSVLDLHDSSSFNFETNPSNLKSGKHFSQDDLESMCNRIGCNINENSGSSSDDVPEHKMHQLLPSSTMEFEEENFGKLPQNFRSQFSGNMDGITDLKTFQTHNLGGSNGDFTSPNENFENDVDVEDRKQLSYDFGAKKEDFLNQDAILGVGDWDFSKRRTRGLRNFEYDSLVPEQKMGSPMQSSPLENTRFLLNFKLGPNGQTIVKNPKTAEESERIVRKAGKKKTPKGVSRNALSNNIKTPISPLLKISIGESPRIVADRDYGSRRNDFIMNSAETLLPSLTKKTRSRTRNTDQLMNKIHASNVVDSITSDLYPFAPLYASHNGGYAIYPGFIGPLNPLIQSDVGALSPEVNVQDEIPVILPTDHSQFTPEQVPLEYLLRDPHLNIDDKMHVLEVIDPSNTARDHMLDILLNEMHKTGLVQSMPASQSERKRHIDTDQLTYKQEQLQQQNEDSKIYDQISHASAERSVSDPLAACKECGGKKSHGKPKIEMNFASNWRDRKNERKSTESMLCSECGGCKGSTPKSCKKKCTCRSERKCKCGTRPSFDNEKKKVRRSVTETCLTSLSGIYANENLSIMFSSHVDIFQLKKPLRLVNHKLLIPKDDRRLKKATEGKMDEATDAIEKATAIEKLLLQMIPARPDDVIAVDAAKFNFDSMSSDENLKMNLNRNSNEKHNDVRASAKAPLSRGENTNTPLAMNRNISQPLRAVAAVSEKIRFCRAIQGAAAIRNDLKQFANTDDGDRYRRSEKISKNPLKDIHSVTDFGYFPNTMSFLERCPHDNNHLCLNMLDEQVPSYSIKLKMPFKKNALIFENEYQVRISNVISDATTKEALLIVVDVINEGFTKQLFSVSIENCPMACMPAKTSVEKNLLPHIGESVSFLLPLLTDSMGRRKRKFHCDVEVKAITNPKTTKKDAKEIEIFVSKRRVKVEPKNRCLCVWECSCHCVPKEVSHVEMNVCHKMSTDEEEDAGLLPHAVKGTKEWEEYFYEEGSGLRLIYSYTILLLFIMLLLGFLKAIIGIAVEKVNRFLYNYVQLNKKYEHSSKCRRFWVNVVIFIILPFVFWCKCFTPSEDDLRAASTEWQCSLVQQRISQSSSEDFNDEFNLYQDDEDEETILSQHYDERNIDEGEDGQHNRRFTAGFDPSLGFSGGFKNIKSKFSNSKIAIFDDFIYEDADSDEDTKFVLQALVESRESLRKLLKRTHSSEHVDINNPKAKKADDFVQSLKAAKIVYRTLDAAVGNIRNIAPGQKFSVQGYFLPSIGPEYEFVNYDPITQYHTIDSNGKTHEIRPPNLNPKDLERVYANKLEVLEAGDLSVKPPLHAPCINVLALLSQSSIDFVEHHRQQWRQDRELNILYTRDQFQGQMSSEQQLPRIVETVTGGDAHDDNTCGQHEVLEFLTVTDGHPQDDHESAKLILDDDVFGSNFDI